MEQLTLVIPAAGRVPEGLVALSNITCPAMIPVGGRPVFRQKSYERTSLDTTKLKTERPDIVAAFAKTTTQTRLTIVEES